MAVPFALFMALRVLLLNFLFFSGTGAENQWLFCRFEKKPCLLSKQGFFVARRRLLCKQNKPCLQTGAFSMGIIVFLVENGCVCLAHNVCPLLLVCRGRRDGNHNML